MFLWLMIAILVAVCSVAGFIYLTRRISAFGFIKKLSKDKKVLKYVISAGLIVLTGGIIWLIWDWINAIICLLHLVIFWLLCALFVFIGKKISKKQAGGIHGKRKKLSGISRRIIPYHRKSSD